jgi:hypothetical protein
MEALKEEGPNVQAVQIVQTVRGKDFCLAPELEMAGVSGSTMQASLKM